MTVDQPAVPTEVGIQDLDEVERLRAAAERDIRVAELESQLETLTGAVAEATVEAIPSKSVELRRLMEHAAGRLDDEIGREASREDYSRKLTPGIIAAMAEASAILRTVAVYVTDSPA